MDPLSIRCRQPAAATVICWSDCSVYSRSTCNSGSLYFHKSSDINSDSIDDSHQAIRNLITQLNFLFSPDIGNQSPLSVGVASQAILARHSTTARSASTDHQTLTQIRRRLPLGT
ncbi:hypothetical protein QYF36_020080 [Acer negundo]|nr:hypothetical protein QYF36_020080 [Acer negundo]